MNLFGRFTGTKKPVEEKKEDAYDFTRFNQHVDNIDAKEAEIARKIEDINREIAQLKEQMKYRGPNYKYLHDKAMNLLKKRKMLENQMRTYSNMSINMNQTRATFDSIQVMQEQYNVMKEVSAAQNKMFQTVNIDDYLNLSDQMQDMRDEMDDVQEMMADALVGDMDEDEDELERELAMFATESMPVAGNTNYDPTPAMPATAMPATAMPAMPEFNLNDELSRL